MQSYYAEVFRGRTPQARFSTTSLGRRSIDAELAYIFEVPESDPEIDEELTAALVPIDD